MSKLTPFQKLGQIKAKVRESTGGNARVSLTDVGLAWQIRSWVPEDHTRTVVIAQDQSPEEAINKAHIDLFPPIPDAVGCWVWSTHMRAYCSTHGAETGRIICIRLLPDGGYVCSYTDGDEDKVTFLSEELRDIPKLLDANSRLEPPTEEE